MNKVQLKSAVALLALTGWGSAQASSPLNWQLGFNLGQRSWESPGYLDQQIDFRIASLSVSTGFDKYFASALYETSVGDEPIELAIDNAQFGNYPRFGFQNSGAGSAKRSEFSMVGGYNLTPALSGFLGYVTSEVDISDLSQLIVSDIQQMGNSNAASALLVFLNGGVRYASHGPFIGVGYRLPVAEQGAFSFSLAYAHLSAEGEVNTSAEYESQRYLLPQGSAEWTSSDTSSLPRSAFDNTVSGSASGFSYGVSWFGRFAGEESWIKSLRYVISAKLYKYDYKGAGIVPSQSDTDSSETYTVLNAGLTKTF